MISFKKKKGRKKVSQGQGQNLYCIKLSEKVSKINKGILKVPKQL